MFYHCIVIFVQQIWANLPELNDDDYYYYY